MKSKSGITLLIFIILTVLVTWPLILHPTSLTFSAKEEFFLSYILNWNIHALISNPLQIFQAPFFYPMKDTLAFSDPLFTSSIIVLPLVKFFHEPFLAYTFNLFLSFVLNGFSVYLVIYLITRNWWVSLVSGVLFSFSIGRIDTLEHLQILTMYWIPLGIYFLIKFFRSSKNYFAFLVAFCFLCQTLNTVFLGYAYIFTLSSFTLIFLIKKQINKKILSSLIKYFILALIILGIIFQPYFRVAKTWQAGRSLADVFNGSSYFLEYLYPTQNSRLQNLAEMIIIKHPWPSYLGAAVSVLGLISLISLSRNSEVIASLTVFLIGLIMSFGPYFQLIKQKLSFPLPLPYWFAYFLIPGFKSMRTPQRWSQLALLGLSLLIGLWLSRWFKKSKPALVNLFSILIIVLVIIEIRWPLFTKVVSTKVGIPAVYHWLSNQPAQVVMELPIQTWVMPLSDLEIKRLHYHSFILSANHTFINGYSGFEPPEWTKTISVFRTLPPDQAVDVLNNLGVNLLIVHWQEMNQLYKIDSEALPLKTFLEFIGQDGSVFHAIYQDSDTTVYQK